MTHYTVFKKPNSKAIWRSIQLAVFLVGIAIWVALVFFPNIGIHAFWNVLIPVAPLLFALAAGFWRNICPMATLSLLPRHFNKSRGYKISQKWQSILNMIGILLLLIIVPLRHIILDTSGLATAIILMFLGIMSIVAGYFFEWKSAWCSGLCPILPVEKLYGSKVSVSPPNAHCSTCDRCVTPCPDNTPGIHPGSSHLNVFHKLSSWIIIGGFPGYIIGWYLVPNFFGEITWTSVSTSYLIPYTGLAVSLFVYFLVNKAIANKSLLISSFAAASIISYYWFRLPSLLGLGANPGNGMLVDLSSHLPMSSELVIRIIVVLFFTWWMILRQPKRRLSWTVRPAYSKID